MDKFKKYRRLGYAEMRPVEHDEIDYLIHIDNNLSVSAEDVRNGSPKVGDMIARNPDNHNDVWLVAEQYFKDNFEQEALDG